MGSVPASCSRTCLIVPVKLNSVPTIEWPSLICTRGQGMMRLAGDEVSSTGTPIVWGTKDETGKIRINNEKRSSMVADDIEDLLWIAREGNGSEIACSSSL